jgi:hypothetical protein
MSDKSMTQEHLDLAMKAVGHVIQRMQADPRIAYLMGPGSETFDRLTEAWAVHCGYPLESYRHQLTRKLSIQRVAAVGEAEAAVDKELLARIGVYDEHIHDLDDPGDLSMLVNHFVERGLDVAEAERDTITKELF